MEDDQRAIIATASSDDDRLAQHLLEFIALGTWAVQPFVVPVPLRSPHARMRLKALFLPGSGIESPRTERVLTSALHDSRPAMRKTAASNLGSMGSVTATPALIEALHDPVPTVQRESAKALGQIRNPAAVPALLSLLPHADEQLGNQIFSSLVRLGPAAIPALSRAAGAVRHGCAGTLSVLWGKFAICARCLYSCVYLSFPHFCGVVKSEDILFQREK